MSAAPRPTPSGQPSVAELSRRYLDAQLAGDRREALRLVMSEGFAAGIPVRTLQVEVVQAAQRRIGKLWQENRISIAQEHMATAISQLVLSRLFEAAEAAPRLDAKVIVACVEGEHHEFPARLVADFLELGGFDVRYLGANVPTEHLARMVRDEKPDLLALSVTMSFNAGALSTAVKRIRDDGLTTPILVGGHALEWEPSLASAHQVSTCGPEPDRVVEAARRLARL